MYQYVSAIIACYRNTLARELEKGGYQLRRKENGLFEIAGVSDDLLAQFSGGALDLTDEESDGSFYRRPKEPALAELQSIWRQQIGEEGLTRAFSI